MSVSSAFVRHASCEVSEVGLNEAVRNVTTILIIRHTEVHNPDAVLYGRLPGFDLSEFGRRHADRLADHLADWPVAAVVSSPLLRARRVAEIIARRHPSVPVRQSSLLTEVGSAWHGTPFRDFPPGFNTYDNHRDPTDESLEQVRDRMLAFVRRTGRRYVGETVVAISHGDPITILRITLQDRPLNVATIRGADFAALGSITRVTIGSGGAPVSLDIPDQID